MELNLISETLSVTINHYGAEISSVKNNEGLEFIWQANKEVWPRHAPVLFPIVGKLQNNHFEYQGRSYEMGQHGFARDKLFELVEKNADSCTFRLGSNDESKKVYPFDFVFEINYLLQKNTLITSYKILNPSPFSLLFAVGAHPGFICPLTPGETFEDYYIEFEPATFIQTELKNGLRSTQKKPFVLDDHKLFLTKTLFDQDALVFENNQINSVSLRSLKSDHSVVMKCENWPCFGIWSKKGCREFVCLEPWYGIADKEGDVGDLEQKEGMISLEPEKQFNCSFSTTFN